MNTQLTKIALTASLVFAIAPNSAFARDTFKAHINQIGFAADAQKQAVYNGTPTGQITIKSVDGKAANYIVPPGQAKTWPHSGENENSILDFSTIPATGSYALFEGIKQISPVFQIGVSYNAILRDALRFYYHHRASTAISEPYAEGWARKAGHNMNVTVYSDAGASTNAYIKSYRGWYDAGDYGRYVVNSGISTYTLLALYEKYKDKIPDLNIPEDNAITKRPQLLSEIKWNLDWMLTMQASDGGVHHKMTENKFGDADESPADASIAAHSVMGKTTAATLNFAAVMAAASRIYRTFDTTYANTMLTAAKSAWSWAVANPAQYYKDKAGTQYLSGNVKDPTTTGDYGDMNVTDEFFFAAAALATVTTGTEQEEFITRITQRVSSNGYYNGEAGWKDVGSLGTLEIVRNKSKFSTDMYDAAVSAVAEGADNMLKEMNSYGLPFNSVFWWGSNSSAANKGIQLLQAYDLTGDVKYKNAAQAILDYILGRNPLDQSYVTSYGHNSVKNTHDRLSASFGVNTSGFTITGPVKAIPGQLAGGASAQGCKGSNNYTELLATRYEDSFDCYGYNEITINWNAPFAFLLAALNDKTGVGLNKNDVLINAPDNKGIWYVFTISKNYSPWSESTIDNLPLEDDNGNVIQDEKGNDMYEAINSDGNAHLENIYTFQYDWDEYAAAAIAVKTENTDGKNFDLSKCTGVRYKHKGNAAHRLTSETPDKNGTITFYANGSHNDGGVSAETDWTTREVTFANFSRDNYDEYCENEGISGEYCGYYSDIVMDPAKVNELRWTVRAFGGMSNVSNGGYWSINNGSLEIKDLECLGASAIDMSNVPDTPKELPPYITPIRLPQIAGGMNILAHSTNNAIVLQNLPQGAKVEAYNLQGKQVYSTTGHSSLATSLTIPAQAKGMYIVKVSYGSERKVLKMAVK